MVFRMFFYTSVFIICWSGPLAHRFAQYWRVNSDIFIYADAIGQRFPPHPAAYLRFPLLTTH
jgi:hypothetical protein